MNTKHLWDYFDAKKTLRVAREDLEEYESTIYSPKSPVVSGMPFEHGSAETDKLATLAQKHEDLLLTLIRAIMAADKAYKMLEVFAAILTDDEREVLYARYRKGMSFRDMEDELHRSERTLRRANNRIKEKFAKFEN